MVRPSACRIVLSLVLACMLALGPVGASPVFAAPPVKHSGDQATITVSSLTRGAKVFLDDQEMGEVPLPGPLEVKPGTYTIRVQKRGFAPFVDTVMAGAGQDSEVEADLVPTGGIVTITSNVTRAQVLLNGKALGRTPFDGDVSPGKHQMQVVAPGYLTDTRQIEVLAGEELAVDITLQLVPDPVVQEDKSLLGRWWFWSAIGVVLVGGVAAGVLSGQTTVVRPDAPDHTLEIP
jgi:hypothetical protein